MYFVSIWYQCPIRAARRASWNETAARRSVSKCSIAIWEAICVQKKKKKTTRNTSTKLGHDSQRATSPSDLLIFPLAAASLSKCLAHFKTQSYAASVYLMCPASVCARASVRVISGASSFCMFGTRLGHLKPREVYPGAVLTLTDCLQWFPLLVSMST